MSEYKKPLNRIRKNITIPPLSNEIIKLLAEEYACSESEIIGRLIREYAEKKHPEILEKARCNL